MEERILDLTLEIIYLLTGEGYTVVKKTSGENVTSSHHRHIVVSSVSMSPETISAKKVLEVTQKLIGLLTGEVPIRCQDVSVYFSMEEWEYLEGHKDLYKDAMMGDQQTFNYIKQENNSCSLEEMVLNLTLEIIYLLTGEDYKVVKKMSDEPLITNSGLHGTSPIIGPPPHCLTTERKKKTLEVIKKIIDLLTGEDVTIYFSMEEWEYLEGHKDLYKDAMMGDQPDGSSKRNLPERCPRPLYSRDPPTQEGLTISHHHQGEELKDLKVEVKEEEEEMLVREDQPSMFECGPLYSQDSTQGYNYTDPEEELKDIKVEDKDEEEALVRGDQPSMEDGEMVVGSTQEESSLHIDTDGRIVLNTSVEDPVLSLDLKVEEDDLTQYSPGVNPITSSRYHSSDPGERSMDPPNPEESPDQYHTPKEIPLWDGAHTGPSSVSSLDCENPRYKRRAGSKQQGGPSAERPFSCVECGKNFANKHHLLTHQRSHTGERPYPCPVCGKCFSHKGNLLTHQRSHTGERPHSCSECGKCFTEKKVLLIHRRIHTGERPYACSECEKRFIRIEELHKHQRVHTGECPYSCPECGKSFTAKGSLLRHQRGHLGERPFSCAECGKRFAEKGKLLIHQRIHTGDKPYACSECGKRFIQKQNLLMHLRIHTGDRPFPCPQCGKCFTQKQELMRHQRTHTGERPFSCSECGKCFIQQGGLIKHQKFHTG